MLGMDLIIRAATAKDVEACLGAQAARGDAYFTADDHRRSLADLGAIFLRVEIDSRVVGYVVGFVVPTKATEAMVHSTPVHRAWRKRGIGRALVRGFVEEAGRRGVEVVFAEVEEGPDRFYGRCRFKQEMVWRSMVLRR